MSFSTYFWFFTFLKEYEKKSRFAPKNLPPPDYVSVSAFFCLKNFSINQNFDKNLLHDIWTTSLLISVQFRKSIFFCPLGKPQKKCLVATIFWGNFFEFFFKASKKFLVLSSQPSLLVAGPQKMYFSCGLPKHLFNIPCRKTQWCKRIQQFIPGVQLYK